MTKVLIAICVLISGCAMAPIDPCAQRTELVKSVDARTTTGRWLMFNKRQLARPKGQLMTMAVGGGAPIEGLNALAFEQKPIIPFAVSGDWVVQPEYVHHILDIVEIKPYACPTPNPNPNPVPIEVAKSWGIARVHAIEAKSLVDTAGVKICDVDTGIDLQHPGKGNVIGSIGYAGSVQDGNGHGTHTAGTLAGLGGVGVSKAKLLICKGLSDSGSGTSSALAQCLSWCGSQGAQIVSNSWGSSQSDQMINQAITGLTAKGIYVFVAAGNDSGPVNWPAKLAGTNNLVYAIAASNQADQITSFSSRGPEVRFINPGENITSNWPGGGTKPLSGTSMATPHVAAVCAFGVAKGIKPCIKTTELVSGYPFADALATAQ